MSDSTTISICPPVTKTSFAIWRDWLMWEELIMELSKVALCQHHPSTNSTTIEKLLMSATCLLTQPIDLSTQYQWLQDKAHTITQKQWLMWITIMWTTTQTAQCSHSEDKDRQLVLTRQYSQCTLLEPIQQCSPCSLQALTRQSSLWYTRTAMFLRTLAWGKSFDHMCSIYMLRI